MPVWLGGSLMEMLTSGERNVLKITGDDGRNVIINSLLWG